MNVEERPPFFELLKATSKQARPEAIEQNRAAHEFLEPRNY